MANPLLELFKSAVIPVNNKKHAVVRRILVMIQILIHLANYALGGMGLDND